MKFLAPMIAVSLMLGASTVAFSQTTETVTKTTITEVTRPSIVLPAGVNYYVINPSSSDVIGTYVAGQAYSPGYYIASQSTGEVLATVDSQGNLVSFTSVPSTLPERFRVVNNKLFYYSTDFASRRADLEGKVAVDYQAGRITNRQAAELREKLGLIALLETKQKKDLTYSKSTIRLIEKRFAEVEGEMAKFVADTNARKAKIGLRVN